jgi:superfamily I DNA/RNA helicase
LNDAEHGTRDTVVIARAGTGKTTTMLAACERFPRGCSIVFLAFNTRIKEEVVRKAPPGVDVRTLHSLGMGALFVFAKGRGRRLGDISEQKTRNTVERLWPECTKVRCGALVSAASFAKGTLSDTESQIEEIVYRLDLDIGVRSESPEYEQALNEFCSDVLRLLDAEVRRFVDALEYNFDDMVWLPVRMGLRTKAYDRVIIDEGQDLNAAQHALARGARRRGGRIVLVGDDRQAIYAWRGAESDGIEKFRAELDATVLRLPVTYRCGQTIVALAKTLVPDYEAAPMNAHGQIDDAKTERMLEQAQAGDAILSRVNAPLIGLCLELLKRGKRARVVGRDVGKSLLALLASAEKTGACDVVAMLDWIDAWRKSEIERLESRDPPGNTDVVCDRADCIIALSEGQTTIAGVRARIEDLFTDDPSRGEIVLSSTHKAKGLEWPTVWMLADTYRAGRSVEESNLYYVAVTRAISRLVLVSDRRASDPPMAAHPAAVEAPVVTAPLMAATQGAEPMVPPSAPSKAMPIARWVRVRTADGATGQVTGRRGVTYTIKRDDGSTVKVDRSAITVAA